MNPATFREILENVKKILRCKTYEEIRLLRKLIDVISFLDANQYTVLIQEIARIEDVKRPSNKEEFDRIMKAAGFGK